MSDIVDPHLVNSELARLMRARLRLGTLLSAGIVAVSWPVDLLVAPDRLAPLLLTRALVVAGCVVLAGLSARPALEPWASRFAATHALVLLGGVEAFLVLAGPAGHAYWPSFMVVITSLGLLYPLPSRTMGGLAATMLGMYAVAGTHLAASPRGELVVSGYFLLIASVVAISAAHVNHRLRRSELESNLALEKKSEELRRASEQLAQSASLSLLGSLSAGLAHEVRNPNHAILSAASAAKSLAERLPASSEREQLIELLSVMDDAARRVEGLVGELLVFARPDAQQRLALWRPGRAIEATLKLLAQRSRGVKVEVELAVDEPVEGYPSRLNQVLLNLVDNAFRAVAQRKGTVRLRTARHEAGLELCVEDDGPGIDPEHLSRIFEPFFTTRPVGQGTGLGLHLARQIVQQHRGRLEVQSTLGHGARFRLWLPFRANLLEGQS